MDAMCAIYDADTMVSLKAKRAKEIFDVDAVDYGGGSRSMANFDCCTSDDPCRQVPGSPEQQHRPEIRNQQTRAKRHFQTLDQQDEEETDGLRRKKRLLKLMAIKQEEELEVPRELVREKRKHLTSILIRERRTCTQHTSWCDKSPVRPRPASSSDDNDDGWLAEVEGLLVKAVLDAIKEGVGLMFVLDAVAEAEALYNSHLVRNRLPDIDHQGRGRGRVQVLVGSGDTIVATLGLDPFTVSFWQFDTHTKSREFALCLGIPTEAPPPIVPAGKPMLDFASLCLHHGYSLAMRKELGPADDSSRLCGDSWPPDSELLAGRAHAIHPQASWAMTTAEGLLGCRPEVCHCIHDVVGARCLPRRCVVDSQPGDLRTISALEELLANYIVRDSRSGLGYIAHRGRLPAALWGDIVDHMERLNVVPHSKCISPQYARSMIVSLECLLAKCQNDATA
ncbi:hypothetical protein ml_397 [Mollivirus sibericum]|uniref:hypothetical protein n=1 Tax=Mollivirus sibericum TaxID=1678078 RepID=UPI0006B2EEB7|nr:hypothetical protein ml_397 [Mollivirus sibericum]ALD62199.1 hypothetical protein ml_397 [Mollivirus sibericum]